MMQQTVPDVGVDSMYAQNDTQPTAFSIMGLDSRISGLQPYQLKLDKSQVVTWTAAVLIQFW